MAEDERYAGFTPLAYEALRGLQGDEAAMEVLVRQGQSFMREEAPLMAVAAGLIPNVHRRFDDETTEEGAGRLAHRLLVSRRLATTFVVCPADLVTEDAKEFLSVVGPQYARLVIAARSFGPGFRLALAKESRMEVTLLTFAGTVSNHEYRVEEE